MTRVSAPIRVEVHFIPCPAADETFAFLDRLGIPYTRHLVTARSERRVMAKYGRELLPTVFVWIGTPAHGAPFMTLEGFNPDGIRHIHRLIQDNMPLEAA